MTTNPSVGLLRPAGDHVRVTYVELFFDLIFVFAVTQLSHLLLEHLSLLGAFETLLLLLAVWWAWIDTSWVTNWLDPERTPVRALVFALMFAGLLLSASIPHAFDTEALLFAISYATIQIGRSVFVMLATRKLDAPHFRNFQRISAWHVVIGALWIYGASLEGTARLAVWGGTVLFECAGPSVGFLVPGLGRSATLDWKVDGAHMAERCALFVIIALGESILVTGATAAKLPATAQTLAAFLAAFLGSVAMWWIYFNIGAERGSRTFAGSDDPGRVARNVYTYFHIPIIAGIVVCAVADEITIAHPGGHVDLASACALA